MCPLLCILCFSFYILCAMTKTDWLKAIISALVAFLGALSGGAI